MDYSAIIDFIAISVPEQFLMALFAWMILGRKETTRLRNVFIVGISAAVVFQLAQIVFHQDKSLALISQVLGFALLIYFGYRLNILETVLGCLVTLVVFTTAQGTTVGFIRVFADVSQEEVLNNFLIRIQCTVLEVIIISMILYIIYRNNINIYFLKKNKLDKSQIGRLRVLILQLAFAFFILVVIYTMFIKNSEVFKSLVDKLLIVSSFIVTIIFTIILVRSVFKMGKIIQTEEELKRKLDGREIIQNIDYLCTLIDERKYGELKKTLQSIKNDIETGMVNIKEGTDREVST